MPYLHQFLCRGDIIRCDGCHLDLLEANRCLIRGDLKAEFFKILHGSDKVWECPQCGEHWYDFKKGEIKNLVRV